MKNKSYAVIGLGQFGMTVALTLAEANCDVLAIDDKDDNVQDIAEKVSCDISAIWCLHLAAFYQSFGNIL